MYDLTHFDYDKEIAERQTQLQTITDDISLVLTFLERLKERLAALEDKPRFAGSIWMKKAKYPYAIYPTDKNGKRKREYVGLDGLTDLQQAVSNHKEYESLKAQFVDQHQRYSRVKYSLGNISYNLLSKQSEMGL